MHLQKAGYATWLKHAPEIMVLESTFPQQLITPADELRETFHQRTSVIFVAIEQGLVVGFVIADNVNRYVWKGDCEYDEKIARSGLYVEDLVVLEQLRGKGYGMRLLRAIARYAQQHRYKYLTGHFCSGASAALMGKLGGYVAAYENDYLGTGMAYAYMVLDVGGER